MYRKSEMLSECTAVQQYHLGVSLYNLIKEKGLEITNIVSDNTIFFEKDVFHMFGFINNLLHSKC